MSGRMNWARVHAEDTRRRATNAPPTTLRRRRPTNRSAARFKVDYHLQCATCHQQIPTGGWARRTVTGTYVHGYGCPPNTTLCATCKTPTDNDHKTNRHGQTVHAHGCPKKA